MYRPFLLIGFLLFLSQGLFSQDTLVTKSGDKIICIVDDVDDEVVLFQYVDSSAMHGYPIDKLIRIIYSDGLIKEFDLTPGW